MKKTSQNLRFTLPAHCVRRRFSTSALSAFILFSLLFLVGCRTAPLPKTDTEPQRTITDDLGRKIAIPEKVSRAVSLAPNLTEIVFAVGAGNKLVGRTSFDNFPLEAQKIPAVGDTMNPNIENIIALKPDIVLVSTASQIQIFTETLERQNIKNFVTNPNNLEAVYTSIDQIGDILGSQRQARQLIEQLKQRVAAVAGTTKNLDRPKVLLQISREPLYTIGADSFLTDLIDIAGGASATKDVLTAYPRLSKETALALSPDVIILSDSDDNQSPNEAFTNSPAVKNGKVYKINADILSRPGPRLVDALEQIAGYLHPRVIK